MEGLYLKPGGKLENVEWNYDERTESASYVTTEVTNYVISFLMVPVTLEGDIRLMDIFKLLQAEPLLPILFRRDWADEYLHDALTCSVVPYTGQYAPGDIEYLELYQLWDKNSKTKEINGVNHFHFHGIGFQLQDDVKDGDSLLYSKDTRIAWSTSFTRLNELLDIPLRVNPTVLICEDNDKNRKKYGQILDKVTVNKPNLAQIINAVLGNLSFHGESLGVAMVKEELHNRCESEGEVVGNEASLIYTVNLGELT